MFDEFDELEVRYSGIISHALYELRTSGATADEIWERLDKIRDEYLAEYEKRCFTTMKHEFFEPLKGKPVTRRAFLFQSAHHEHIQPHFARCVAVEVALALGVAAHGELNQRRGSLNEPGIRRHIVPR